MCRSLILIVCLTCAAGASLSARAAAAGLPVQVIEVFGRVVDLDGGPVPGAVIALERHPQIQATSDSLGDYMLSIPLHMLGDPDRGISMRVTARRPRWSFTWRNGQPALAVNLRALGGPEPRRCKLRSNDLHVTDALAGALMSGERGAMIAGGVFVGTPGRSQVSGGISLRSQSVVVMGEPAPPIAPATPDSARSQAEPASPPSDGAALRTPPPPRPVAAKPRPATPRAAPTPVKSQTPGAGADERVRKMGSGSQSGSKAGARAEAKSGEDLVKLPGPGVKQTDASMIHRLEVEPNPPDVERGPKVSDAVLAGQGDCPCRIKGTVELHPDHLLTRPLDLIVLLHEAPAVRDTLQLFMGSPRSFMLPLLKCGTYGVEIHTVSQRVFSVVSSDGREPVDCREGGLRQLRIVLTPR